MQFLSGVEMSKLKFEAKFWRPGAHSCLHSPVYACKDTPTHTHTLKHRHPHAQTPTRTDTHTHMHRHNHFCKCAHAFIISPCVMLLLWKDEANKENTKLSPDLKTEIMEDLVQQNFAQIGGLRHTMPPEQPIP